MVRVLVGGAVLGVLAMVAPAAGAERALDAAERELGEQVVERGIAFLRARQDEETGGWSVNPRGPDLPAIAALVLSGMLMEPGVDASDPDVSAGLEYVLGFRRPTGEISDGILANYNTAISLSALSRAGTEEARSALGPGQDFLRGLQWSDRSIEHPETGTVGPEHAFYGGVGYGGSGRPDLSNLSLMLQGLHDSGLAPGDAAYDRAVAFLERVQMHDEVNAMPYAEGSEQGGFIYSTSPNGDEIGVGESKAGMIEEEIGGERVSRLRAYGSMTYAGFKSYLYAGLERDDRRVQLAYDWITSNYELDENPGIGTDGYYYYLVTFARALDAWGEATIEASAPGSGSVRERDWAGDLIRKLAELQEPDGGFRVVDDRWMEDNRVLITAYCVVAAQYALGRGGGRSD